MKISRYVSKAIRYLLTNKMAYFLYRKILWRQVKDGPIPEHIGVILDGNRRWAIEHRMPTWLGHKKGASKVMELIEWCHKLGVKILTLYVLSTENFKRKPHELSRLLEILEERLKFLIKKSDYLMKYNVRIKAIGRLHLLPQHIRELIYQVESLTKSNSSFYVNIAVAYGGRCEIVDAVRKIAEEVRRGGLSPDDIDDRLIERFLYTSHLSKQDPDLIIRTSGEERLSNFLLWQSAYSELLFLDVYWPDFRDIDLLRAIRIYQQRKRRFGA